MARENQEVKLEILKEKRRIKEITEKRRRSLERGRFFKEQQKEEKKKKKEREKKVRKLLKSRFAKPKALLKKGKQARLVINVDKPVRSEPKPMFKDFVEEERRNFFFK